MMIRTLTSRSIFLVVPLLWLAVLLPPVPAAAQCDTCDNGTLESGEQCDDGNTTSGDGCSASCQIEPGWTCSGSPSHCTTICGRDTRWERAV